MIIDSHMHLSVDFSTFSKKKKALLKDMDNNGIEKGIIIADSEKTSDIGSVEECEKLFANEPRIKIAAGISPFIDFDKRLELSERLIRNGTAVALKLYCAHEGYYIDDISLDPVFETASVHGVPVMIHSGWDNPFYASPDRIKSVSVRHRNTTLVYCHCNYPDTEICFDTLYGCENVYFDVSSVADNEEYYERIRASLEKAISIMPHRFIFGSDHGCCNQKAHLEFCHSLRIDDDQKEMLFHKNAERIFML